MPQILDVCPKCGELHMLVDHHPFPRRYFGNGKDNNPWGIYIHEACHRYFDNKIVNPILQMIEATWKEKSVQQKIEYNKLNFDIADTNFRPKPEVFVYLHVQYLGSLQAFLDVVQPRGYNLNGNGKKSKRDKKNNEAIRLPEFEDIISNYQNMTFVEI